MDELDGIPLFRGSMLLASVTNSSDFVLSQLQRSSYESAGRSCPWYILDMEIWIMCFVLLIWSMGMIVRIERRIPINTSLAEGGVILLTERLPINTSPAEGGAIVTRAAKCSMATSNGGIEIMLGSHTIHVPKFSRYILEMWCFLVLLLVAISYKASFAGELRVITFSMAASDGGRSSYGLVGHSSPWYILDLHKELWISSSVLFVYSVGVLVLIERISINNSPSEGVISAAKFSRRTSKVGIEIVLGSCTLRVPKSSSAHKPILQMVRFARYLCGVASYMAPKYILQSRPSTSQQACEAGPDSARRKSKSCNAAISEAILIESSGRIKPEHRSVPMDACDDTAEQHCDTMKVEAMVAASPLVASAAPNSTTWNRSLLSGFTPRYGMKIIAMMIIKMCVASMKIKMLSVENKYLSQTITSSEHKDEHLGAARALSDLQTEEENTLVLTKTIPDTKPEHPSGPDTIKAEERKAAATWLIATAASHHATGDRSLLSGFTPEDGLFVEAGDGSPMQVLGRGSVVTDAVVLPDVWFVPGLMANLVSVSKLTELDYSVGFARAACYIRGADDGAVVGKAHAGEDGMFELDFLRVPPPF